MTGVAVSSIIEEPVVAELPELDELNPTIGLENDWASLELDRAYSPKSSKDDARNRSCRRPAESRLPRRSSTGRLRRPFSCSGFVWRISRRTGGTATTITDKATQTSSTPRKPLEIGSAPYLISIIAYSQRKTTQAATYPSKLSSGVRYGLVSRWTMR